MKINSMMKLVSGTFLNIIVVRVPTGLLYITKLTGESVHTEFVLCSEKDAKEVFKVGGIKIEEAFKVEE